MHRRSGGTAPEPVRTSGRLKGRTTPYGRGIYYYTTSTSRKIIQKRRNRKNKTKTRTAASHIAKIMRHGGTPRPQRSTTPLPSSNLNADASNLRRSTRKRTLSKRNRDDYITDDSSGSEQDEDIMKVRGKSIKNKVDNSSFKDELPSPKHKKMVETRHTPRREGLRPRRFNSAREQLHLQFDDELGTSDEKIDQDETENGNDIEYNDADDAQNEADGEDVGDGEGDDDGDGDGDGDEDGDDEEGDEEQDGRRRYDWVASGFFGWEGR